MAIRNKKSNIPVICEHSIAADKVPAADILLDALDQDELRNIVRSCGVTQIYLLAAILSARGEQDIHVAWKLKVQSLLSVLEVARDKRLDKIFWPSSIAVFVPGSPKYNCPQQTRIEPNTVYDISKRAGEYWCNYYFEKFGRRCAQFALSGADLLHGTCGRRHNGLCR